jgi:hypothetical protein
LEVVPTKTIKPFGKGNWYKGNMHCHSTHSDGSPSPEEAFRKYREQGYHFVALTDHNFFTNHQEFSDEQFLVIPGMEHSVRVDHTPNNMHVLIYQQEGQPQPGGLPPFQHATEVPIVPYTGPETLQHSVDEANQRGAFAVLAHPTWSRYFLPAYEDVEGFLAMEIFNYGCEMEQHWGLSTYQWDVMLRKGKKLWGMAGDDAHNYKQDFHGAWIQVKAAELTLTAIFESLVQGRFYSSSGPEIYDYGIRDGEVFIECSPVNAIHFITYEQKGESFWSKPGETLTSMSYRLKGPHPKQGPTQFVRVECADRFGRTAWTNPIFLR